MRIEYREKDDFLDKYEERVKKFLFSYTELDDISRITERLGESFSTSILKLKIGLDSSHNS